MGRDTTGVRGMNVARGNNAVIAMDVARDDQELLVVTENGFGKRTALSDYPRKGRGTMGVKTISLTEAKGALAGALVVREHEELVFISMNGMVQRTSVRGINRYGRSSQGVRVMNLKDDDIVSAVALVAEGNGGAGNGDHAGGDDGNGASPPVAELIPEPVEDDDEPTDDELGPTADDDAESEDE
jgi:DNA gyrase subunit A